jgi:hypothetical protein
MFVTPPNLLNGQEDYRPVNELNRNFGKFMKWAIPQTGCNIYKNLYSDHSHKGVEIENLKENVESINRNIT